MNLDVPVADSERARWRVSLCKQKCVLRAPSPGAGGAVCLWHLWSTDSVQVPPLCRYNAHLHPELSCTPATPPLAGWSAHGNTGTRREYTAHTHTHTHTSTDRQTH